MADGKDAAERAGMTLDAAREAFENPPDTKWRAAADYVATAVEYWNDGIISHQTYAQIVKDAALHL